MENATQALLIAGMVFLALMTITFFVYMSENLNTIGTAQEDRSKAERLAEWNSEWEAFNKKLLYGAEVMSVVNKVEQNNADNGNDSKYTVTISIKNINDSIILTSNIENYKKSIFQCTKMEYSNETGRVNKIEFKLIEDLG